MMPSAGVLIRRFLVVPTYLGMTFIFLFFAGFILLAPSARAISVSPAIVELTLKKGTSETGSVSIQNTEDETVSYGVSFSNFVAKGEEGQQDFVETNVVFQDLDWITPQSDTVTLGPKQKIDFSYKIRAPKDARPGGHYVAMFLSKKTDDSTSGISAKVSSRIGILFFIRINGEVKENLKVESFRLVQGSDGLHRLPVVFEARFQNLGNVHVTPQGDIVIRNIFGRVSAIIQLNPKGSRVLTNSVRRVESQWKKEDAYDGRPTFGWFGELKNEWRNFAFGRYTAEMKGYYGESGSPLSGTIRFWIVPWHLLTASALLIAAVLILIRIYSRLLVRTMLKRANKK
jgi:hypothetical protein